MPAGWRRANFRNRAQPPAELFPRLLEVGAARVSLLGGGRRRVEGAKREAPIAWDLEVVVRHRSQRFKGSWGSLASHALGERLCRVQGQVQQDAVSRSGGLEGLEEDIRLEESQNLVNDVVSWRARIGELATEPRE